MSVKVEQSVAPDQQAQIAEQGLSEARHSRLEARLPTSSLSPMALLRLPERVVSRVREATATARVERDSDSEASYTVVRSSRVARFIRGCLEKVEAIVPEFLKPVIGFAKRGVEAVDRFVGKLLGRTDAFSVQKSPEPTFGSNAAAVLRYLDRRQVIEERKKRHEEAQHAKYGETPWYEKLFVQLRRPKPDQIDTQGKSLQDKYGSLT